MDHSAANAVYEGPVESLETINGDEMFTALVRERQTADGYRIRFAKIQLPPSQHAQLAPGVRVRCTFASGEGPTGGLEALSRARVRLITGEVAREDILAAVQHARTAL